MIYFDNVKFSTQKSGGITVLWAELMMRIIAQKEIDFRVLEYPSATTNLFRKDIEMPNDKIIELKEYNLFLQKYIDLNLSHVKDPFLFHSSYYRICKNTKAKNITTVHDFVYELYIGGIKKTIHSWQKNKAIRNSEAIICISENTKNDLLKFLPDVDQTKIHVVYNGVSDDYFPLDKCSENLPFPKDEYVLFVGDRSGYKNFSLVLKALQNTVYNLVIVGKPLENEELQEINQYLKPSQFKYVGRVDNSMLNELYNNAFALLYLSAYEGFGIPVIEAEKAACPVVALAGSSISEIASNSDLLCEKGSREEVLSVLEKLNQVEFRKDIVQKGLENSAQFSWQKNFDETLAIYRTLL